jgi:hypothetical protein
MKIYKSIDSQFCVCVYVFSKYKVRNEYMFRHKHGINKTSKLMYGGRSIHCKKRLSVFPSPARMSITNLSLAGNNLTIPGQGEFGK